MENARASARSSTDGQTARAAAASRSPYARAYAFSTSATFASSPATDAGRIDGEVRGAPNVAGFDGVNAACVAVGGLTADLDADGVAAGGAPSTGTGAGGGGDGAGDNAGEAAGGGAAGEGRDAVSGPTVPGKGDGVISGAAMTAGVAAGGLAAGCGRSAAPATTLITGRADDGVAAERG